MKKDLIPVGTATKVRLGIRPGGYNDKSQGWTGGAATIAKSGAIYLNCECEVLDGPYAKRKFDVLIGLKSSKGPWWGNQGRKLLRDILNSAYGLSDKDTTLVARQLRHINSFDIVNDLEFVAEIGIGTDAKDRYRNEIKAALTLDDPRYKIFEVSGKNLEDRQLGTAGEGEEIARPDLNDSSYIPMWAR